MLARILPLLLPLISVTATAADHQANPLDVDLCGAAADDRLIPELIKELQRVEAAIPGITSEDVAFDQEKVLKIFGLGLDDTGPAPNTEQRLQLEKRLQEESPLHYLIQLRQRVEAAKASLGFILLDPKDSAEYQRAGHTIVFSFPWRASNYTNSEAVKLLRATYAIEPLNRVTSATEGFLRQDDLRTPGSRLSASARAQVASYGKPTTEPLANYIRCKLSMIAESKSTRGVERQCDSTAECRGVSGDSRPNDGLEQ